MRKKVTIVGSGQVGGYVLRSGSVSSGFTTINTPPSLYNSGCVAHTKDYYNKTYGYVCS